MAFIQQRADETGELPQSLREWPELDPALADVWRAFGFLHDSRQIGMDEGPIPFTEIDAYMRVFPTDDPETFVDLIQAMDREYLRYRHETRQRKPEPLGAKARPRG